MLVYGPAKSGKTTFSMTAPAPRLLLDVESASRFIKTDKITWDPLDGSPPPEYDGKWDTCVVNVHEFASAEKAYDWLRKGEHPFKSVILDSISELQGRAQEAVNQRKRMQTQNWGDLLSKMSYFAKDLRDLTTHKTKPLEAVIITATEKVITNEAGRAIKHGPYLQGQISSQIPYWVDVCGYYYLSRTQESDGTIKDHRNLLVGTNPEYEAGNRVPGMPDVLYNANIAELLDQIFGSEG